MRYFTYIVLFTVLLFSCAKEEGLDKPDNKKVEILLSVNNYTKSGETDGKKDPGTAAEREIRNLYLFLFSTSGAKTESYEITNTVFSGGQWSQTDGKITLALTQEAVGTRGVYIIANYDAIKSKLSLVTKPEDLNDIFSTLNEPWSNQLTTPILMVGHKEHNFATSNILDKVSLERAIAKLKFMVTLSPTQQAAPGVYKYRYVNFATDTRALKDKTKSSSGFVASDWKNITLQDGSFSVETYLNENYKADESGRTRVEIIIPDKNDGLLPPPEFGDEVYRLLLPKEVERNTFYQYNISLDDDQTT